MDVTVLIFQVTMCFIKYVMNVNVLTIITV